MAFLSPDTETLAGMSDRIMPAVWAVRDRARAEGIPIEDAAIQVNHLHDNIELCVRHVLVRRRDMDSTRGRYDLAYELGRRLQSAMRLFHRMPQAKAICVDRRRLLARGEKARKDMSRPKKSVQ